MTIAFNNVPFVPVKLEFAMPELACANCGRVLTTVVKQPGSDTRESDPKLVELCTFCAE